MADRDGGDRERGDRKGEREEGNNSNKNNTPNIKGRVRSKGKAGGGAVHRKVADDKYEGEYDDTGMDVEGGGEGEGQGETAEDIVASVTASGGRRFISSTSGSMLRVWDDEDSNVKDVDVSMVSGGDGPYTLPTSIPPLYPLDTPSMHPYPIPPTQSYSNL